MFAGGNIVRRWMFPEDYRAFRSYVKEVIRHAARDYLDRDMKAGTPLHFTPEHNDDDSSAEPSLDPKKDTREESIRSALSYTWRTGRPVPKEELSVPEAAVYLNVSQNLLLDLIRKGKLKDLSLKARIAKEEVERIRVLLTRQLGRRTKREGLGNPGDTRDAESSSSSLSQAWRSGRPVLKDKMSVAEAAAYLNLSQSYIHRLVAQGRLKSISGKPMTTLSKDEVQRAQRALAHRREVYAERERLEITGKTREASRKSIYRKLGRLPRV